MPTPPEIGNVEGPIRGVEVHREADTEQQSRSDGNVAVAGKIVIELKRIGVDGNQDVPAGVESRQVKDAVDKIVAEIVGNQKFLGQSKAYQEKRTAAFFPGQHDALPIPLGYKR